jgi:hypothetical protein
VNWFGQLPAGKEGFEFHILALTLAFAMMGRGAGPLSFDRILLNVNVVWAPACIFRISSNCLNDPWSP